ncbi:MAG: FAD-dependent thymidylate synthase [Candidatus Eremiobacteraeota bacterium]|nr:FAD-dependent thymidylate synthase [Candidatus Eremiobacteraeota bacterium]
MLLDSVAPSGVRLTTLEVTFPRFVLAEFNTHRQFCLDGDTTLSFESSATAAQSPPGHHATTLRDFHDGWHDGAAATLRALRLGSCDEVTGEIYRTHVVDAVFSGRKPVFRVTLRNGQSIVATKHHRFMTSEGWQTLEQAAGLSSSAKEVAGWKRPTRFAVNGIVACTQAKGRVDTAGVADGPSRQRAVFRHFVEFDSIAFAGERDTYDLEVAGPFHNFVADGFIVHNSRNSASSRAVPTTKLIERVEREPALPLEWGRNKAGMSASDVLSDGEAAAAMRVWLSARDDAVRHARRLLDLKVHKQELNRILEPFLWHTVIVTATEWQNFFELRSAANAQPEIRAAAIAMREAMASSRPRGVRHGEWHTPLLQPDEAELALEDRKRISAARCARVSYLTHDGKRELEKDLQLCDRLREDRHLSPFEHVATPAADEHCHANFRGWIQMRAEIERGNGAVE